MSSYLTTRPRISLGAISDFVEDQHHPSHVHNPALYQTYLIDRHNRTRNTNTQTRNDTPRTQHANILRRALNRRPDDPQHTANLQRHLARVPVGQERREQRADERPRRHRRRDGALAVRLGVVEVLLVGLGAEDARHG